MAELPRQSPRTQGQSPEVVTVADLLRRSRRLRGQPPEEVPSHYKGLKVLVSPSDSKVGSPEEGESLLVVHPDYQSLKQDIILKLLQFPSLLVVFHLLVIQAKSLRYPNLLLLLLVLWIHLE